MPTLQFSIVFLEWQDVGPTICKYLTQMDIQTYVYLPMEKQQEEQYLSPQYLLNNV